MSIRTTVTLDDDVRERVKEESRRRGMSFKDTLNDLVRLGLLQKESKAAHEKVELASFEMGVREGLNYDDIEGLIEYTEGPSHL